MEYKVEQIKLSRLALNTGQIDGLPANPRQWTRDDIERIAKSLKETPELFEMRPIIAVDNGKEAVILAGSLRFCGAKENGNKTAPTILLPADYDVSKMKEIVIKDNGSFGAWDMDSLANEWDDLPLKDWGAPEWVLPSDDVDVDSLFEDAGKAKDKDFSITISIPKSYEGKLEDIKSSIELTLAEWAGCKVK